MGDQVIILLVQQCLVVICTYVNRFMTIYLIKTETLQLLLGGFLSWTSHYYL